MANRRMFSKDIVSTDRFYDLPTEVQALYFHLGMNADDDGFVASPRSIMQLLKADKSRLELLVREGYIMEYPDGVCLVSDWLTNNQIRKDRYRESRYCDKLEGVCVIGGRYFPHRE